MPDDKIVAKKMRTLSFQHHDHHLFSIHGRSDFHRGWTEEVEVGTTEDYYFINLSNVPHPMHFHLVNFQVIK
jgi:FtsP/CotA-like multicopper oxidase with cupredoxin domain